MLNLYGPSMSALTCKKACEAFVCLASCAVNGGPCKSRKDQRELFYTENVGGSSPSPPTIKSLKMLDELASLVPLANRWRNGGPFGGPRGLLPWP